MKCIYENQIDELILCALDGHECPDPNLCESFQSVEDYRSAILKKEDDKRDDLR